MLRELQAIGWSLLDSQPVPIKGPVSVLIGQNGSCKSSFMDAAKALLGARRFGSNRSPSSYRYTGRAGQPAAKKAYLLGLFRHDGQLSCARQFTVIMEAGPNRRYFLVLDGDQIIRDQSRLVDDLEQIGNLPRAKWLSPEQYQKKILEPLGFGPAMRRFLELPQGELSRVLDRDNSRLVELMLELTGGRDASDSLQRANQALDQARQAQANADRRLTRSRVRLAEQRLEQQVGEQHLLVRRQLAGIRAEAERFLAQKAAKAARGELLSASRAASLGLELIDGYWTVPPAAEQSVANKLGAGERLPGVKAKGWIAGSPLESIPESQPEALRPALRRELKELVDDLIEADIDSEKGDLSFASAAELLGAARAFSSAGIPERPGPLNDLSELEANLEADRSELERREEVLARSRAELKVAEQLYAQAAESSLLDASQRFSSLCHKAGMDAEMQVRPKVGGVDIEIRISEERGGELRSLTGARNSLSGGWKATVIVFALLSCLGADQAPPMLLIDEVGSSLDEERLGVLGEAFRLLGDEEGSLTMLTIPSKTMSQTVSSFASQQIAFFRPLADEPVAPPPHIVEERGQLSAAA